MNFIPVGLGLIVKRISVKSWALKTIVTHIYDFFLFKIIKKINFHESWYKADNTTLYI